MKILFYCPLKSPDDPVPSGDREFARGLQDFFREQGHDVFLVSRFKARLFYRSGFRWIAWLFALILTFFKTLWYRPDVVFVYHAYYKCPDALGWIMARIFAKPYFIFECSYSESARNRLEDRLGYWMHQASLATVQRVYTNIRGDVPGLLKVLPPEKVHAVVPSLDWSQWKDLSALQESFQQQRPLPEGAQIVSVAMLRADRKTEGVRFLVRCLARIKNEGYHFTFQHVGGGPCFSEIENLCDTLELNFHMHGSLSSVQVREVLSIGTLFAFPGIDEGLGLAYLEAQAAGLPCVAFNNGGIPEVVVNNETGFLTPLMDEEAYCAALRRLLDDHELAKKMGALGRQRVEELHNRKVNYERMAQDMISFKNQGPTC